MFTITFRNDAGQTVESRDFASHEDAMNWGAEWRVRSDWFSAVLYFDGMFRSFLNR